ncbi:MAG TPA: sugar ABC transporter ATP-binding protein [Solirubrobacteraceae bacterium]|jgi:ribose transport system ATP-binding protein
MSAPLLEIRSLTKAFPGVRALAGVDLTVDAGEIVALLGQNGSGKSTLVKILAGVYDADPGSRIDVDGEPLDRRATASAKRLHFIHQDLGLVNQMNTLDNLDIARPLGWRGLTPYNSRREARVARERIRRYGVDFSLRVPIGQLSAAERTIIAIVRALEGWSQPRNVLVLDEPTAALHGQEVHVLFDAVRQVARSGAGVIFVSHRLDEVLALADRVVVLRDGVEVLSSPCSGVSHSDLARAIAGREVTEHRSRPTRPSYGTVLEVKRLRTATCRRADLVVDAGEIVGVTGLMGSGAESLLGAIYGARPRHAGEVSIRGKRLRADDPVAALRAGVGFVPADRKRDGAVVRMNVRENITLAELRTLRTPTGQLGRRAERAEALRWIDKVDVRPRDPERNFELMSGGNQQKVVIAKYLRTNPHLLLLDEPTQGVDVGAKQSIYELLSTAADDGAAVVVYSSDTKELAALCHRVLVLCDGVLTAEIGGEELGEERLVRESLGMSGGDDERDQESHGRPVATA